MPRFPYGQLGNFRRRFSILQFFHSPPFYIIEKEDYECMSLYIFFNIFITLESRTGIRYTNLFRLK